MSRSRSKTKGRKSSGRFVAIPHAVMNAAAFTELNGASLRLLLEIARQYNGRNNGDLSATFSQMQDRGFRSKQTLSNALNQLIDGGFIVVSRHGYWQKPGQRCALYAITWQSVDECPGKDLEIGPTNKPWKSFSLENSKNHDTKIVPNGPDNRVDDG